MAFIENLYRLCKVFPWVQGFHDDVRGIFQEFIGIYRD